MMIRFLLVISLFVFSGHTMAGGQAEAYNEAIKLYEAGHSDEAFRKMSALAVSGHLQAEFDLGVFYAKGSGTPQSYKDAFKWYKKAANRDHSAAQNNLGLLYANGQGVKRNYGNAVLYLALGSLNGSEDAAYNLKIYKKKLTHGKIKKVGVNIRNLGDIKSRVLRKSKGNESVYALRNVPGEDWVFLYFESDGAIGWVARFLVDFDKPKIQRTSNSRYPSAPAARDGYITCRTNCTNGNCFRTYSDGRQVNFQAKQVWDPFNNTFKWDSGGC